MRSGRNLENSVMFRDLLNLETRLSSIESQPKKVVVVVVVIVVVFIIVGHKNLTLKFGKNWVSNR